MHQNQVPTLVWSREIHYGSVYKQRGLLQHPIFNNFVSFLARRELYLKNIAVIRSRLDVCIKIEYPSQYGGEELPPFIQATGRLENRIFHNFVSFFARRKLHPKKIFRFYVGD